MRGGGTPWEGTHGEGYRRALCGRYHDADQPMDGRVYRVLKVGDGLTISGHLRYPFDCADDSAQTCDKQQRTYHRYRSQCVGRHGGPPGSTLLHPTYYDVRPGVYPNAKRPASRLGCRVGRAALLRLR